MVSWYITIVAKMVITMHSHSGRPYHRYMLTNT